MHSSQQSVWTTEHSRSSPQPCTTEEKQARRKRNTTQEKVDKQEKVFSIMRLHCAALTTLHTPAQHNQNIHTQCNHLEIGSHLQPLAPEQLPGKGFGAGRVAVAAGTQGHIQCGSPARHRLAAGQHTPRGCSLRARPKFEEAVEPASRQPSGIDCGSGVDEAGSCSLDNTYQRQRACRVASSLKPASGTAVLLLATDMKLRPAAQTQPAQSHCECKLEAVWTLSRDETSA